MLTNQVRSLLVNLPRSIKKIIVVSLDIIIILLVTWLAFCLRFDEAIGFSEPLLKASAASIIICLPIFIGQGLYRAIYRYSGWHAASAIIRALSIYAPLYILVFTIIRIDGVPRSIGLIQPILLLISVCISRLLAKSFLSQERVNERKNPNKKRALIYGAGVAGQQLASGLRQGGGLKPVAFIDDNQAYWNSNINGLRVYPPNEIKDLLGSGLGISDVLLAMPSTTRARQREILARISDLPVHVRILPGLSHLAHGTVKVEDIREVQIEDVLGRVPVEPNNELIKKDIVNKVVLVTGAGGSIGSELCRQIFDQKPGTLILFDVSEFALYTIERELSKREPEVKVIPILGSVTDRSKLTHVMKQFNVQTVYHAAAYKHVPMIEVNSAAGVWNNIFGTLHAAESALQTGVETFVLISSDKAVRPTNVMGCTKRFSELLLQAKTIQQNKVRNPTTKFTMVRFGNVLGSSGSVIPVFREQIRNGGPVTVTHPEIIRYFMTIPEAAQLVIQAGAMCEGGDVMVLDMGDPIKIVDLARQMIHLSGLSVKDNLNPDGDIEIIYTGLRPGEKLYEELLIGDNTLSTSHPRIMRASELALSWEELEPLLTQLQVAVDAENQESILGLLKKAVPEFHHQSMN